MQGELAGRHLVLGDGVVKQRPEQRGAFGVGDTPLRLSAAEQTLEGEKPNATAFAPVVQAGMAGVTPQGDIHADARYRRALLGTLLDRALQRANERIYS